MIHHKLTTNFKKTLLLAKMLAFREGKNKHITTVHLLSALLKQRGSLAWKVLHYEIFKKHNLRPPLNSNRSANLTYLHARNSLKRFKLNNLNLTATTQEVIEKAISLAYQGRHYFVGTEHLLTAIIQLRKGRAYLFFKNNKINLNAIEKHLNMLLENASKFSHLIQPFAKPNKRKANKKLPVLNYFGIDLNAKAQKGDIDPLIGREQEMQRIINILGRRTKNNPLLIGDAGVGKTAIAEGLAYKIIHGEVPPILQNKRIILLDLTSLVAGTMFRGEFESRLKKILQTIENDPNVILFIDELHTVIGTGGAMGSLDTANILKPALARGTVRCIGATTLSEYQKYIEKDRALERRFQPVMIRQPSVQETIEVLRGIKENYETFHNIKITERAVESAAILSDRFIPDRLLPDKAIDLIDEAASREKINLKEPKLVSDLRILEEEFKKIKRKKIELVQKEAYHKASAYKQKEAKLLMEISQLKKRILKIPRRLSGQITAKEIKKIISEITQVPLSSLTLSEKRKLLNLERNLNTKVISQGEAIKTIAQCIRRNRAGVTNPQRPLGSFIFLGPSGVGKTYLAQILSEEIFGSRQNLVRIDMSEFREHFNVARLIGAPAGYVGYEEGGKLTEKIRHQPYSVVLFDEIEKAHPEALNLLLQILEDGLLTDAQGREVNFKNTIIIMTSNIGSAKLALKKSWGFRQDQIKAGQSNRTLSRSNYSEIKKEVLKELEEKFKPEFLNRVDKIIVFKSLGPQDLAKIAGLEIKNLDQRIQGQKISLHLEPRAASYLAQKAFNPLQGARPLRRIISEEIEDRLATLILDGKAKRGDHFKIKFEKQKINLVKNK